MCGRFGLVDPDGLARRGCLGVLDISDIASDVPDPYPPRYNIAPSQPVLAAVQRAGKRQRSRTR